MSTLYTPFFPSQAHSSWLSPSVSLQRRAHTVQPGWICPTEPVLHPCPSPAPLHPYGGHVWQTTAPLQEQKERGCSCCWSVSCPEPGDGACAVKYGVTGDIPGWLCLSVPARARYLLGDMKHRVGLGSLWGMFFPSLAVDRR